MRKPMTTAEYESQARSDLEAARNEFSLALDARQHDRSLESDARVDAAEAAFTAAEARVRNPPPMPHPTPVPDAPVPDASWFDSLTVAQQEAFLRAEPETYARLRDAARIDAPPTARAGERWADYTPTARAAISLHDPARFAALKGTLGVPAIRPGATLEELSRLQQHALAEHDPARWHALLAARAAGPAVPARAAWSELSPMQRHALALADRPRFDALLAAHREGRG